MSDNLDSVETIWQDFWVPIVAMRGPVDIKQVKRELHDYYKLLKEVPLVYYAVTNGRISSPATLASEVIGEFESLFAPIDPGPQEELDKIMAYLVANFPEAYWVPCENETVADVVIRMLKGDDDE